MDSKKSQLSKEMYIVRDSTIIAEELIKDFIKPGACYLLFDQQDLRRVLYNYYRLCYFEIDDMLFHQFDNIVENILEDLNKSNILAVILVKGGNKDNIIWKLRKSIFTRWNIPCLFARSNTLEQNFSIKIYFFEKASQNQLDILWETRLNEAVKDVLNHNDENCCPLP